MVDVRFMVLKVAVLRVAAVWGGGEGSRQRNEAIGKLHWELSVLAMGGVRRSLPE